MNMVELAKELIFNRIDWVVLDTETTGLDDQAEAVQIGILSPGGEVLLDTLVRPTRPIPVAASQIHGIYDRDVTQAPTILDLESQLITLLLGKIIAVYNAPYDARILIQSFAPYLPSRFYNHWAGTLDYVDIMGPYAEHWGEWSGYHGSYRWQRLSNACLQQGLKVEAAHSAIGDCRLTLALIQKLAGCDNGR